MMVSISYATGLTDGLFEGCGAWLTPDGACEITTSALEEEAAKKSGLPIEVFRSRDDSTKLMRQRLKGHRKIGINAAELTHATFERLRTIVGSGPNGAEPHYTAGPRKIQGGDMIVIDFGAMYRMYCSDITRTVVVGKASEEQKLMHDTVARAQAAAFTRMKPGARGKSVDAAARALIDGTKYKGRFIHGLGHSIGLAVHDGAGLHPASEVILKPNMVFTDEPGVYVPGFGGVRIEDDVLVTRQGPKYLSTTARELLEL